MTTTEIRQELRKTLPTDEIFDAFVVEYFPKIFISFSRGMSRLEKETSLLAALEEDILLERLYEFRDSPSYILTPLFGVVPGGKHRAKRAQLRWSILWKKIRRIIYADTVLHILSNVLEWIAEKLGAQKKDAEHFRNFRPLFILILLIIIVIAILRRCG